MTITTVEVRLWGQMVGAAAVMPNGAINFNYADEFITSQLEVAPIVAPLSNAVINGVSGDTFYGLPEFLADALPDKFGNAIIDAWFAKKGVSKFSLTAIDRLCYVGSRAMGALTFHPASQTNGDMMHEHPLVLSSLVDQARSALSGNLKDEPEAALNDILSVGISAGGARAKAVIAYNEATGEVRSGQIDAPEGFSHWLLKFDGVGRDDALGTTEKYGRIEYAYYLMAQAANIEMSRSRLLEENGRAHFMTQRFDRNGNDKIHLQSLCAIASLDFNLSGAHSYEQFFTVTQALTTDNQAVEQAVKRAFFNIISRNQDDHTKNMGYLMSKEGNWSLSPAYDITHAYNPESRWTRLHQMSFAGKVEGFDTEDLINTASQFISESSAYEILEEVNNAVSDWALHGKKAGLTDDDIALIAQHHRKLEVSLPKPSRGVR